MSEITIKQYVCFPNSTEIGSGNTKDHYVRVNAPEEEDIKNIFPIDTEFYIEDEQTEKKYPLKLARPKEGLRINQLGDYYKDHDFKCGDELIFSDITSNQGSHKFIKTIKHNAVVFKSHKDKGYEIFNIEKLETFKQGEVYSLEVNIKGTTTKLELKFSHKEKKRDDSPNPTDFYEILTNANIIKKDFYLEINKDSIKFIEFVPKKFVSVKIDSGTLNQLSTKSNLTKKSINEEHLQQIFYGAPGTGKSHKINEITQNSEVIRTTFHPDTDYSSFVGAYKPTTTKVIKYNLNGSPLTDNNGNSVLEEKITYKFIPQSFLKAYISAWKKLANVSNDETTEKEYLIIEEINRGNCAQIFGDLFQLLDRDENGFSKYHIEADADIQKHLSKEFDGLTIQHNDVTTELTQKVLKGEILLLPNNLFIWATMNTSDQSLFPIDSAFKRRWDWIYVPIFNANKNWTIEIDGSRYDWWDFLEKINEKIESLTNSEDKKLGYFFCKPNNGVISKETFVGKVIFYLWNDVFKDYEFDDDVFKDEDGQKLVFNKFYSYDGTDTIIDEGKVQQFLSNLQVEQKDTVSTEEENQMQEQTEEQVE